MTPALATEPTVARVRPADAASTTVTPRLLSLDAYRGLIMITLAFTGFGLAGTAKAHLEAEPDSALWQLVYHNFEHVEWAGCGYWDLIQPSFMFMVGVAMAFSNAKRREHGQTYSAMLGHAVVRSLVLILLGVYFTRRWELMNVLTQIGLGYTFLFLLWDRSPRTQAVAAVCILAVTYVLYLGYSAYDPGGSAGGRPEAGVSAAWAARHLDSIGAAWHKNANVGHAVDLVVLNALPRDSPFQFNNGGYQTINFLPSLATMLFGLMSGELLRGPRSSGKKLLILLVAGLAGLGLGTLLDLSGLCPIIKRIWTPSWALYSTGWCCLILLSLYAVIDVLGWRRWSLPLVIVGMNSLAMYFMGQTLRGQTNQFWHGIAGPAFTAVGPLWAPMLEATLTGMLFWLLCLWLYRQRIFIRI